VRSFAAPVAGEAPPDRVARRWRPILETYGFADRSQLEPAATAKSPPASLTSKAMRAPAPLATKPWPSAATTSSCTPSTALS